MFAADAIRDDYKKWSCGDTVIIHAQTGAGKTYFVLQELLPFVAEQGKKLLYLSNRSALRDQVKLSYPGKFNDVILAMNYQSFERVELGGKILSDEGKRILSCEYWVMDEGHYFLADGSFNSDVLSSMINISGEKKKRVLIFMTATPEYLLLALGKFRFFKKEPPLSVRNACAFGYSHLLSQMLSVTNLLKYKESDNKTCREYDALVTEKNFYESYPDEGVFDDLLRDVHKRLNRVISPDKFQKIFEKCTDYIWQVRDQVAYYEITREYKYVNPIYFKKLIQLCEKVERTSEQEKWIIFVSSKAKGEKLKAYFEEKKIECVLITAETKSHKSSLTHKPPKDYEVYQSIINKEKSPVRVTITTAVLDNGVNLKDSQLKHVAVLEMNPTTFLQMLGRKRLEESNEKFNLYLEWKDTGEIKAYFQRSVLRYVKFLVELETIKSKTNDNDFTINDVIEKLINFERQYQVNGTFRTPFCNYVSKIGLTAPPVKPKFGNNPYLCCFFEPNPISSTRLLYDYYRMLALLESYENVPEKQKAEQKERLWIEHQLSWMGLEYDPVCWIDYWQHLAAKKDLELILSKNEGQVLSKQTQEQLKEAIITVVNTSHPPMDTKIGKASKEKVNAALAELGYQQRIKSKNRSIKGKQRNYWHIVLDNEAN